MRYFLIILGLLTCSPLSAQINNFLLMGTVKNNPKQEIVLQIDKRYINNTIEEYGVVPNEQNHFGVACRIEIPQVITLKYGKHLLEIFAEPQDTLYITFDAQTFPHGITFNGRAKGNNELWQAFREQFPKDVNVFRYRQYRKGIYYYKIHEKEDQQMRQQPPEAYLAFLDRQVEKKQTLFHLFVNTPQQHITQEFQAFLRAEIKYDYLLKRLTYGHVYGGRHQLDSSYFDFLDSALVQQDLYLGSQIYRDFYMAWVNFQLQGTPQATNPYIAQYDYAKKYLRGRTKYFIMARMIALALRKNPPKEVTPIYEDFIKENPYFELDRLVLDPFQKANLFAAGTAAPDFELQSIEGDKVQLSQLKGKVVYIGFWASWCRPCMEKMEKMSSIIQQYKNKEVVFLHISLDRQPQQWEQTVEAHQFAGTHLFANPSVSTIVHDYEIVSVPKFFLITTQGNFAYTPTSYDSKELQNAIDRLLK